MEVTRKDLETVQQMQTTLLLLISAMMGAQLRPLPVPDRAGVLLSWAEEGDRLAEAFQRHGDARFQIQGERARDGLADLLNLIVETLDLRDPPTDPPSAA